MPKPPHSPSDAKDASPSKPSDVESANVDELKGDVPRKVSAGDVSMRYEDTLRLVQRLQARNRFQQTMQGAEIARLHQQNELRPKFFAAAAALAWVVILGNFVIVGWYAWHAREALNPNVLMFWISSTVVEVLGIVYIIAQYLFPKVAASKTGNKEDASADVRNASKETISD